MRIWVLVGGILLAAGWTAAYLIYGTAVWALGLPVIGAAVLLVLLDNAFHVGRWASHKWRRRKSGPQRAAWTPDPSVNQPITYSGILPRPPGEEPAVAQGVFRNTGVRLAVLPF